ncbi:ubiquitin-like-conjugating enzyme ATG10 [Cherax quadricarinatus]|uniref:ubiquitin-like-conjugating enzyme ATG10 n=1 Tax=Cherax quadricarinatus TaxID=27406 RepID=UPI0023792203|nr:ubiquitin-like-conjugating enzyme ATG10 [Cherax quadricarinatus]XP_053633399.1 ubiquitin-like-conjugating enzyme ATG10 [Cherax quadricarinatus]XP_053633400.1 ubiquitin-like-conjugating enzyme ATG10 [Cherax quadricarinatus]
MACITYKEFREGCLGFFRMAQKLGDNWECRGNAQEEGGLYLCKRVCYENESGIEHQQFLLKRSPHLMDKCSIVEGQVEEGTLQDEEQLDLSDPSALNDLNAKNFITFEYHIVYSLSHSVPTLYFNAWTSSGKLLTLEQVWRQVHTQFSEQIQHNKWETLTQNEHPLLGRPFFQLHPCNTAKLMSQVTPDHYSDSKLSVRYIISWLSMFGPVIGLELALDYFVD